MDVTKLKTLNHWVKIIEALNASGLMIGFDSIKTVLAYGEVLPNGEKKPESDTIDVSGNVIAAVAFLEMVQVDPESGKDELPWNRYMYIGWGGSDVVCKTSDSITEIVLGVHDDVKDLLGRPELANLISDETERVAQEERNDLADKLLKSLE